MQQNNPLISERGMNLIKKLALGGALIGGGTALSVDLVNYLNHLHKNKEEDDDDTLYVTKVRNQVKAANVGAGLALAGAVAAGAGSYAAVHKAYKKFRKHEAQKELDKAQHAFVEVQGYKETDRPAKEKKKEESKPAEMKKKAAEDGKFLGFGESLASTPVALSALMALAAGATGYTMLNNAFPVRKPKVKGPRRIEIVNTPTEAPDPDVDEYGNIKTANAHATEADGREFLIRMLQITKNANVSDIANVIHAYAVGRGNEFRKVASDLGVLTALDVVKGMEKYASSTPLREHLATISVAHDEGIGNEIGLVAAGEFATAFPEFYKRACALDEDTRVTLVKIACVMGKAIRAEISSDLGITAPTDAMDKNASVMDLVLQSKGVAEYVNDMLHGDVEDRLRDEKDDTQAEEAAEAAHSAKQVDDAVSELSSTSGANESEESGLVNKPTEHYLNSSKTSKQTVSEADSDDIDKLLSSSEQTASGVVSSSEQDEQS